MYVVLLMLINCYIYCNTTGWLLLKF